MTVKADSIKMFTLYWSNGKRTFIEGENINHATSLNGLGVGAIKCLEFHREGRDDSFGWNPIKKEWEMNDMHYHGYD